MSRTRFEWKLPTRTLLLGERTYIVGVLNVTPDSFSDGGKYADPNAAVARALELEEQGADIIDIGAESTRPGSERVSEAEELRRLVPVLKKLRGKLGVPISVDTYKSAVAEKALEYGVEIINDPSGLTWDAEIVKPILRGDAGLIINHMRGTPETWATLGSMKDPITTIAADLTAAIHRAVLAGIDRKRIVADPGLGFGKRKEQNAEILALLGRLAALMVPTLVGPSRKHFVAQENPEATEFATAAAVTAAILNGAHLVRVHDVAAMKAVAAVADQIAEVAEVQERLIAEARAAEKEKKAPRRPRVVDEESDGFQPVKRRVVKPPLARPVTPIVEPPAATEPVESIIEGAAESVDAGATEEKAETPATEQTEVTERAPRRDSEPLQREYKPRIYKPRPERDRGDEQREAKPKDERTRVYRADDPTQREFRPRRDVDAARRPAGDDRPTRRAASDERPARRGAGDERPPRRTFGDRDDRPPRRTPSDRDPRPPRRFEDGDSGPKRFGPKPFGSKPFGRKPDGDRPFGEKKFGPKKFGEKRFDREGDGERRPFRLGPRDGEARDGGFEPRKRFGDKPFGAKPFGPKKEFGEKREYGPKKDFGEKRPYGPKKEFGPKREYGPKKEFGAKREYGPKRDFGPKKEFGPRRDSDSGGGPGRGFAAKKKFGAKSFDKGPSRGGPRSFDKPPTRRGPTAFGKPGKSGFRVGPRRPSESE